MKKRLLRISLIILIILILIPTSVYLALQTDWGQKKASQFTADLLSEELGVKVSLGKIDFKPIQSLAIADVLILDHHADTLLYAQEAKAAISLFQLSQRKIHLDEAQLSNGVFKLIDYEGEDASNLQPIIDKLSGSPSDSPWDFKLDVIRLAEMRIERSDKNKLPLMESRFDPAQLRLNHVNANLQKIDFPDGGFSFKSESLSFEEKSGLVVKNLVATAEINATGLEFTEMVLETQESRIAGELTIDYASTASDSLGIETMLDQSRIQLKDLGYFIPAYADMRGVVGISGHVSGVLGNLVLKQTEVQFGDRSHVRLSGRIKGLPDIESLWLSTQVEEFRSDVVDLNYLPVPQVENILAKLPPQLKSMGDFGFDGSFIGGLNAFHAKGKLGTDLGEILADIEVRLGGEGAGGNSYDGFVELQELDLGSMLGLKDLGTTSSRLEVSIHDKGEESEAVIDGQIDNLSYKGFTYRDVTIDGKLQELLFNGLLSIQQPEVNLDFLGLVDLRNKRPKFDFTARLFQADLGALGLVSALDSTSITGNFVAAFEGNQIDDFTGTLVAQGLSYCKDDSEYFFKDISLDSRPSEEGRVLELHSTPLDATLDGAFKFAELKDDFLSLFDEVLPSLMEESDQYHIASSDFGYALIIKDIRQLAQLFAPGAHISKGTMISGRLDSERNLFTMNVYSDTIAYKNVLLEQLGLEMERVADVAYVSITSEEMTWGDSLRFKENYYTFNAYRDSLETDFTWSLVDKDASGSISALSILHASDSISTIIYPSQMVMSGTYWLTQGESEILYDDGDMSISPFELSNGDELLSVVGDIGSTGDDSLKYRIENFRLRHLNKFLPSNMAELYGEVELSGHASSILGKPTIVADLFIDEFSLGGERVGDIDVTSTWSRGEEYLLLKGGLDDAGRKALMIDGKYYPKAETDNFDASMTFDEFDLSLLNKLPLGAVSDLGGTASGELIVKGEALEPDISGELDFDQAKVHVDYLNTDYTFSSEVKVRKNYIATDYIPFEDKYGNKGRLNGTVVHENFKSWNYDLFAEFENMLVLNTTEAMNETFFGDVYGTGSVSLSGFDKQLTIEVYGKTEKNTVLELPLAKTGDIVLDDFVYFKRTAQEDSLLAVNERPTTGIDLFIEVDVTPDAHIKLIFDEKIGDVVEGNGQGTLTMTLNKSGVFEMFGNYLITNGDYLFTLQNVVNKRFIVAPGSTVSFFGDPYDAELDLTAIYKLRASLSDLLTEYGDQYANRVAVNCEMSLNGQLFNPDISFGINFPDLDPGAETLASSKLSTEDELNKQVFSLLVLNKFLSTDVASAEDGIAGVTNTGSEFASAQLSNWLSQISDQFDIGVNYRAADNINSEEMAVALTTQLFNDRLLLSGNFGVQGATANSGSTASSVIGDFRLEYFIMPDGRLRLKVYSESNDNTVFDINQAASEQGVGLVFQKEFDGLFRDKR